jgi:hypothetical protein
VSWGSFRGGGWVSWYGLHYNSSKSFIAIKLAQERCMAENIARNNGTASAKWKSRFCAVFRGIKSDAGGVFTGFGNPEGIDGWLLKRVADQAIVIPQKTAKNPTGAVRS